MPFAAANVPERSRLLPTNDGIYADYTIKRGCRTRSNHMLQPLARTRFREKILKFFWILFL